MGSVVTYWSGTSQNALVQVELFSFIAKLAALSDDRWRRNHMSHAVASERTNELNPPRDDGLPANNVRFDQSITGRVLLGPSLMLLDQLNPAIQRSAQRISGPNTWPGDTLAASLAFSSKTDEHRYAVQTQTVKLRGIAFRLYDPRGLYPGKDWMSFAFVEAPELPELNGQIVQVLSRQACQEQSGEWLQNADWAIDTPSVHLRYYLEEWFDLLMTWIKVFFISDLEYWRDTVLKRYDEIKPSVDRLIQSDGHEVAKQAIFEYIIECFDEEADQLEDEIAKAS